MAHDHCINDAEFFVSELILIQFAQTFIGVQRYVARRWLQLTGKDFHEGGLTAPIGANQAIAVAFAEFDGDVFKQWLNAKLHGDIRGCDHVRNSKSVAEWTKIPDCSRTAG